jgi:DsbC/DsbD-like thiol-disulfide interchange protein
MFPERRMQRFTAMTRFPVLLLSLGFAAVALDAQMLSSSKVSVEAEVQPARILPGSSGKLLLTLVIVPGWHINANGASRENVLPTEFVWMPPNGVAMTKIEYPRGEPVRVAFQDEPLMAYRDEVQIVVDFRVDKTAKPGVVTLAGEVTVQACSDEVCLAPSDLEVSVPVEILRPIYPGRKPPR